ncbi:hypothetical protein [Calothrix sp. UHCC 0171]|uniref:hypothetical protein n=1 Tax=Calothrix sp. UHCC 0171 TaxID=3110245 RepID=UPI002B1EB0E4|nr:hypothetical protein [Calothrix sp. UHCC 0171]MEA5573482.1 hypothetical protein [Calothrix sp. UHCC 0171]
MKPFSNKSKPENCPDIIQAPSNTKVEKTNTNEGKITNTNNAEETISVAVKTSKLPFPLGQLVVLGFITVAIVATFFLVTRGNDFCLFSICSKFPYQNPMVYSFWSAAGGLGAFGILALMGISAPIAIIGGLATWFLMQISLH